MAIRLGSTAGGVVEIDAAGTASTVKLVAPAKNGVLATMEDLQSVVGVAPGTYLETAKNLLDVPDKAQARANLGLMDGVYLFSAQNLADVPNKAQARANLGIGDSALQPAGAYLQTALNLSDVPDKAAARTNIGAGDAFLAVAQSFTKAQRGAPVSSGPAIDMSLGNNFTISTAGALTLAAPTNQVAGQSGVIIISGATSIAFSTDWKFEGGTVPSVSGTTNILAYYVHSAGNIAARMIKDVK